MWAVGVYHSDPKPKCLQYRFVAQCEFYIYQQYLPTSRMLGSVNYTASWNATSAHHWFSNMVLNVTFTSVHEFMYCRTLMEMIEKDAAFERTTVALMLGLLQKLQRLVILFLTHLRGCTIEWKCSNCCKYVGNLLKAIMIMVSRNCLRQGLCKSVPARCESMRLAWEVGRNGCQLRWCIWLEWRAEGCTKPKTSSKPL